MKTRRNRPVEITDAPEHRSIPIDQINFNEESDELILTGYASTFEPYEMYGGPASGYGWFEQLDRRAFDVTMAGKPDLHLLINHEGTPLARTKSETLQLSVDDHGLKVEAKLDRANPLVQGLESAMKRGDMDEMSFAFRVKKQEWRATDEFPDDDQAYRMITEVSLHKGDVSIVNFGANPTTSAALRALAALDAEQIAEIREDESFDKGLAVDALTTMQALGMGDGPHAHPEVFTPTYNGVPTGTFLTGVLTTTQAPEAKATPTGVDYEGVIKELQDRIAVLEAARVSSIQTDTNVAPEASQPQEELSEDSFEISLDDVLAVMGQMPEGDLSLEAVQALL